MSILEELSSSVGDRTQASNLAVLQKVKADLTLLDELLPGLASTNIKLLGDCAEIFTMIAEKQPEVAAPYITRFIPLFNSKDKRVRWEAMHTLAFTARLVPETMAGLVPLLEEIIARDNSVIVRDYAIQALGEYALTGPAAAREVFPILLNALAVWEGKHVFLALEALDKAAQAEPTLAAQTKDAAQEHSNHPRAKVKQLVKKILKKYKK